VRVEVPVEVVKPNATVSNETAGVDGEADKTAEGDTKEADEGKADEPQADAEGEADMEADMEEAKEEAKEEGAEEVAAEQEAKEDEKAPEDDENPADEEKADGKIDGEDKVEADGEDKADGEGADAAKDAAEGDAADGEAAKEGGEEAAKEGEEGEAVEATTAIKNKHIRLTVTDLPLESVTPLSDDQVDTSRQILKELHAADARRRELESVRNDLEAHVYQMRDFLDTADRIDEVVSAEEKEKILAELAAAEDWLFEEGFDADLATCRLKMVEVKAHSTDVRTRHAELERRPLAVEAARTKVANLYKAVASWNETKPWLNSTDTAALVNKTQTFEKWLNESVEAQEKQDLTADPVFSSLDVESKLGPVETAFKRLARTPKPRPPKVAVNGTQNGTRANGTHANGTKANATEEATAGAADEAKEGVEEGVADGEVPEAKAEEGEAAQQEEDVEVAAEGESEGVQAGEAADADDQTQTHDKTEL